MRDKEEELENSLHKIDSLRQDIRKAEKLRRELELRADESAGEALKEKKSREKLEAQVKQLELDVQSSSTAAAAAAAAVAATAASSKISPSGDSIPSVLSPASAKSSAEAQAMQQELAKLEAELEKAEAASQEAVLAAQTKHIAEVSALREHLEDAEQKMRHSEQEASALREKLDKARFDAVQESEETMSELKAVYEREKLMLLEESKKMQYELERTVELNSRLQMERRQFEEEYQELRTKKEAVAQWEAQISEIINWSV